MKVLCERGTLDYGLDLEDFQMHAMAGPHAAERERSQPATLVCYQAGKNPEALVLQEPNVLDAVFARELSYFVDCAKGKLRTPPPPLRKQSAP